MAALYVPGFEISAIVTQSAQAAVCRARRQQDNQAVVVKLAYSDAEAAKLVSEFELLQFIESAHVVRAYDLTTIADTRALILEDVAGQALQPYPQKRTTASTQAQSASSHRYASDLSNINVGDTHEVNVNLGTQRVNQRFWKIDEITTIAQTVSQALSAVHAAGIIHRDVTLGNIIWHSPTYHATLIDFGIAVRTDYFQVNPEDRLPGTLAFMAPEQLGGMVDARADLYSLGVCLYTLTAGHMPFVTSNPLELMDAHQSMLPPSVDRFRAGIPADLSRIIMRLLAKQPDDRYNSSQALLADLRTSAM
ncbi:MAG: serine/threonine-protein kinase [Deinococcota bacterium]